MVRRIGLVGEAAGMSCWQFCSAGLNQLRGGALAKPESGKFGALKQPIKPHKITQRHKIQACMTSQLAISDGLSVA
jgi:hypothetical protein